MTATRRDVPTYEELMWPTLKTLEEMGGSASIRELTDKIAETLELPEEVLEVPHTSGNRTSFEYRCAWARTHLKYIGAVDNSDRGVWAITEAGRELPDAKTVVKLNREKRQQLGQARQEERHTHPEEVVDTSEDEDAAAEPQVGWQDQLLSVLQNIEPSAFERLCQRLLREAGFSKVEVTGKSGDGGIDGVGVLKVNLLSFHVCFQSKRYAGSVSSPEIRNFRGGMQGRADKGLFITTGRFTKDAETEATRDGAPAIDLIDGLELCDQLKRYNLGVSVRTVEEVSVSEEFFSKI